MIPLSGYLGELDLEIIVRTDSPIGAVRTTIFILSAVRYSPFPSMTTTRIALADPPARLIRGRGYLPRFIFIPLIIPFLRDSGEVFKQGIVDADTFTYTERTSSFGTASPTTDDGLPPVASTRILFTDPPSRHSPCGSHFPRFIRISLVVPFRCDFWMNGV